MAVEYPRREVLACRMAMMEVFTILGEYRDREPPAANNYADIPWPLDHWITVRRPLTSTPSAPIFPLMWNRADRGLPADQTRTDLDRRFPE